MGLKSWIEFAKSLTPEQREFLRVEVKGFPVDTKLDDILQLFNRVICVVEDIKKTVKK